MNNPFSRRDFFKIIRSFVIPTAALGFLGYGYSTEVEMNWIEVKNLTLKLPRLDPAFRGVRLAQVSDFHLGQWIDQERLDRVIQLTLEQKPDFIALTGDYVEYRPYGRPNEWATYADSLDILRGSFPTLAAYCPTLAILGNHDHRVNAQWVEQALTEAGVTVMRNSVQTFMRGEASFHIAAVDDVIYKMNRLDQVLASLPADGAAVLLAHEPDFADTSAATGRFDLQISGHTHGGQINIPLIGPPILPELGQKYPSGLYNIGDMLLYTNRGVGVTTVNARFNCRPEITVFTLEPA
jgi:hypothetical protein